MQVHQALAKLVEEGLVRRTEDFDLAYWFKHVLTQDTVYASLLRHDRRTLHHLLGDVYQSLFADQQDDYLLPLAHHYAEAGDTAQAIQFLMRYGERATQISAYPEAIQAFQRALALAGEDAHVLRAQVHNRLGDLYCRRANYESANQHFDLAIAQASSAADAITIAAALSGMARAATQQGEHARANELGERALEYAQAANAPDAMARAHRQVGISFNFQGNNRLAQEHLQAALDLYRALGDADGTASALNSLGVVAREEQDLEQAWTYFHQALELSQQRGDKYSTGIRLNNLGVIAEQRGDIETATQYQAQAHALAVEIGDREGAALTELNLGSLALSRGESKHALSHFQHALAETLALNSIPFLLYTVAALAKWQARQAHFERGAELLGLALAHPSSTADIAIDFEPVMKELETKLGTQEYAAALARGKQLELRETVREILQWTETI